MSEVQAHTVERTLVLLKPDALARGLAGKIIARFEDAALKIVGAHPFMSKLPTTPLH